jgi:hypothetical protein
MAVLLGAAHWVQCGIPSGMHACMPAYVPVCEVSSAASSSRLLLHGFGAVLFGVGGCNRRWCAVSSVHKPAAAAALAARRSRDSMHLLCVTRMQQPGRQHPYTAYAASLRVCCSMLCSAAAAVGCWRTGALCVLHASAVLTKCIVLFGCVIVQAVCIHQGQTYTAAAASVSSYCSMLARILASTCCKDCMVRRVRAGKLAFPMCGVYHCSSLFSMWLVPQQLVICNTCCLPLLHCTVSCCVAHYCSNKCMYARVGLCSRVYLPKPGCQSLLCSYAGRCLCCGCRTAAVDPKSA